VAQREGLAMVRSFLFVVAFALSVFAGGSAMAGAIFLGPGPWLTGNDTGGIIPYSPAVAGTYREMAAQWCAGWGRLSHITSVHRIYGDYISFVCIDKPWMIH
jgi:hypothetical protein